MRRTVVQLVGSPVDEFHARLSRLYADDSAAALRANHDVLFAHVDPGGSWRFPQGLDAASRAVAAPMSLGAALHRLAEIDPAVVVPQMFCRPGMTDYRALLDLAGLPWVGNTAQVMANCADKAVARALVAAAGVAVPPARVVRRDETLDADAVQPPVVVKPCAADNSPGVSLVRDVAELPGAIAEARRAPGGEVLVETYVPLGREVRCAVLAGGGELRCLPPEEYALDPAHAPIRIAADKLADAADGALRLVATEPGRAWIVPDDDTAVPAVCAAARACFRALGCRHYGLFDFRIDPDGVVWFLEAGPYCSFARGSVIAKMAAAEGMSVDELFDAVCREAGIEGWSR